MASAEFWYEFASTYSYPAALRVAALADERGVSLVWRPFLLGPIFFAQGWRDSPINVYPAKGRYMWRDLERTCGAGRSAQTARALSAAEPARRAERASGLKATSVPISRRVFVAEFGSALADRRLRDARRLLTACGADPAILERAGARRIRRGSLLECARAVEIESSARRLVTADGEVFWGNDRLEQGSIGPRARRRRVLTLDFVVRWRTSFGRIK